MSSVGSDRFDGAPLRGPKSLAGKLEKYFCLQSVYSCTGTCGRILFSIIKPAAAGAAFRFSPLENHSENTTALDNSDYQVATALHDADELPDISYILAAILPVAVDCLHNVAQSAQSIIEVPG